ncbi:MAG: type I DNA topoisomerase [Candidatus Brocadiia bacterium]
MAKSVVIVESPAKARTIGKFLGKGFRVESCMGHVRDLPEKAFGVDIEEGFKPRYQVLPSRRKVVRSLRKAVEDAEAVYLAPDPDREGESIAWHLHKALRLPKSRVRRVAFNEITQRAVRRAFEQPRGIDMNLVNAQQARRILDRIVGYQLSPLLWRKLARGLSAGRVQSVALRLLVEREREIRDFEPQEYWEVEARLVPEGGPEGAQFVAEVARLDGEKVALADEQEATALVERLGDEAFLVAKVQTQRKKVAPRPPFATSQLQQAASVRLGFRPRRTMLVAQQLYEGIEVGDEGSTGLITYMRTDSFRVSQEALGECRGFIQREMGEEYLSEKPRRYRSRRGAQEAHEAIRPTSVARTPESLEPYLSSEQLRLYRLIWQRFVASQMAAAQYDVTRVTIEAGPAELRARGRVLVFDGHTRTYEPLKRRDAREDQALPQLAEGASLRCLELLPSQHFTKPPPRYTEASLVKTLERKGIGRPSTYAQIITTLQERGYAEVREKAFHVNELGEVTNDALLPFFDDIINTDFTSQLEEDLDAVEEAEADWREVLAQFYEPFKRDLEKAQDQMPSIKKELAAEEAGVCEKCGAPMVMRLSKRGRFLACSAFPKCRNTRPLDEDGQPQEAEELDEKCPQCGETLVVRTGRRGKFVGCSGFPECRYTRPVEGEKSEEEGKPAQPPPEPTGEKCPRCGAALVVRTGRRGRFVGCSAFPKCRFTRSIEGEEEPQPETTDVKCEKCGAAMVIRRGRRGRFLACSAYPKCKNTKPLRAAGPPPPPEETGRKCPECGQPLVVRTSRRGKFIGCSGFPKCRYTEDMEPSDEGGEAEPKAS